MIDDVNVDDFDVEKGGQVEIIGWLYQYYNTEPKDYVIGLPKSHKYRDTEIASATQIFTPDWIVKYMVENSLGKLWIKSLIQKGDSRSELEIAGQFGWQYYMEDAKQPEDVESQLKIYDYKLENLNVEDIKLIDPAMGSGHILVYAFDVLMKIYEAEGYSKRDAATRIMDNNLHGLDIDTRAFQLSYFAVMMKARQYNRRALTRAVKMNIYDIPGADDYKMEDFEILLSKLSPEISEQVKQLITDFNFGDELGSLISESNLQIEEIEAELKRVNSNQLSFELLPLIKKVQEILDSAKLLMNKYHVVVTNPPYMGSARMGKTLSSYAKKNYPNSKSDFFGMFMERWNKSLLPGGYNSMVTMQSWMFLSSFEKMRVNLLNNFTISNLMHMENNVMGIAFGTAVTIVRNMHIPAFVGTYHQIKTADATSKVPQSVPISGNRYNRTNQANFSKIPGMPIAYWASNIIINKFNDLNIGKYVESKAGIVTGKDSKFIFRWYEINFSDINYKIENNFEIGNLKFVPYSKGGDYARWFGNDDFTINLKKLYTPSEVNSAVRRGDKSSYFKTAISWSYVTSNKASFRIFDKFVYGTASPEIIPHDMSTIYSLLALLNSKVSEYVFKFLNPTINLPTGYVLNIPVIPGVFRNDVLEVSRSNIDIVKKQYFCTEESWHFEHHPLLLHIADDKKLSAYKCPVKSNKSANIVPKLFQIVNNGGHFNG
ncbi:BREX-1 system adenine-specific DNA-methyltransferase PglX [Companilactobacillus muriivasis]|uniref:BREX-1 system adenine-specific DNA-methyltransferase PglX n=1 Tax=Companilactobacillus muriivasis TaxID=3081444 RepID=UPI003F4ED501